MMVVDYSERRQLRKAPPAKRPSILPSLLLIFCLMLLAFAAGLGTGWYLLRPGGKFYRAPVASSPAVPVKKADQLPPQGQPVVPVPSAQAPAAARQAGEKGSAAPPLTFYNTLQKGNKGLMGTGLNQPKEEQPGQPLPQAPAKAPEH